jgi:hypothetical protein
MDPQKHLRHLALKKAWLNSVFLADRPVGFLELELT